MSNSKSKTKVEERNPIIELTPEEQVVEMANLMKEVANKSDETIDDVNNLLDKVDRLLDTLDDSTDEDKTPELTSDTEEVEDEEIYVPVSKKKVFAALAIATTTITAAVIIIKKSIPNIKLFIKMIKNKRK